MNIKEEIKEFTKLIKKYPDIKELYIGRAALYTKIGEYKKAVKDYEIANKNHIYDIISLCKRHYLSWEIDRIYTQEINKDKSNAMNYVNRARFYMRIGADKKALADCEAFLRISPKNKLILGFKKMLTEKLKAK